MRLCQPNQDYTLQRLFGLQAKRTRLQPRCGPLAVNNLSKQSFCGHLQSFYHLLKPSLMTI